LGTDCTFLEVNLPIVDITLEPPVSDKDGTIFGITEAFEVFIEVARGKGKGGLQFGAADCGWKGRNWCYRTRIT
jgi:hypothetical protein